MKYTATNKISKKKYAELDLNISNLEEYTFRIMINKLIDKLSFSEIRSITKISTLKVDPYSTRPYNGCKALLSEEKQLVASMLATDCILFEVYIYTSTQ